MPMPRVRFTIARLMIAVAVVGGFLALFRVPGAGAITADVMLMYTRSWQMSIRSLPQAGVFTAGVVLMYTPVILAILYPSRWASPERRPVAWARVGALCPLSIPWSIRVATAIASTIQLRIPRSILPPVWTAILILPIPGAWFLSIFSSVLMIGYVLTSFHEESEGRDRLQVRLLTIFVLPLAWIGVGAILNWNLYDAVRWFDV